MMAATGLACNAPSATPSSERAATGSRLPPVTLSLAQVSDAGVRAVDTPAPEGSVFGDLHSDPHGALVLSWVEPAERGGAVRFASRSDDGAWSEVRTAVTDAAMPVMWADPPRVFTFADDAVIVTWPRARDEHGYGLWFAISRDMGRTFDAPQELPAETRGAEYGFPSFAREGDRVRVAWLDGRATAEGGATQLRAASVGRDGSVADRRLIDRRVCDCCSTDAVAGREGPVVVYRGRGAGEVRDVLVAGLGPAARPVHDDRWTVAGCPVNGPAIAGDGGAQAIAWFTGVESPGAVLTAFVDDGAIRPPIRVDAGAPLGRVDVLRFGEHAVVTWLESVPDAGEAVVLLRAVGAEGAQAEAHRMAAVSAGVGSGSPRLGAQGDELFVAYTSDRVRLAALRP